MLVTKTMLTFVNLLPMLMLSFMPWILQVESLAPPYIRLKAVLDEPNGFGYGIDLPGFGPTLSFQNIRAHTLKPTGKRDSDMKQGFVNGTIRFFEDGDGHCLEAVQATKGSSLNAPSCDSEQILQMWEIKKDDTIRLTKFPLLCLTVEGEIGEAGPWWKKDLKMNSCDTVEGDLKRWEVHSNILKSQLLAHILKPTGKNDSDMKQGFVNGTIRFFEDGDGHCLEAVHATKGSSLNAPSCDSEQILQMWEITKNDTIRLTKFPLLCLTVEGEIGKAGPWWKKDLKMNSCDTVDEDLKRWEVHSNGGAGLSMNKMRWIAVFVVLYQCIC